MWVTVFVPAILVFAANQAIISTSFVQCTQSSPLMEQYHYQPVLIAGRVGKVMLVNFWRAWKIVRFGGSSTARFTESGQE